MLTKDAGMLVTSMNMAPENDAEFNQWFDKEHLEERAAIPGFENARRYVAIDASRTYLSVYATSTFGVLDGPDYRRVLANQTARSKHNMANFVDPGRIVARIVASAGKGWGAYLGLFRFSPGDSESPTQRSSLAQGLAKLVSRDHIVAASFIVPDEELSRPLGDAVVADPVVGDWFVLLESTREDALTAIDASGVDAELFAHVPLRTREVYRLLWGMSSSELTGS